MSQCADTCGSIGSNFRMLAKDSDVVDPCLPADFSTGSTRFEILKENMRATDPVVGGRGLTGTLDPVANHLRGGARIVYGRVALEVGPNELEFWLPKILGNGTKTVDDWATKETFDLEPTDLLMDREGGVVIYRHCVVNRALIESTTATSDDPDKQVVKLVLDFIGMEEHDSSWPVSPPALPSDPRYYWLHGDTILTLGSEYNCDSWSIMVDNMLVPKTRNHLIVTCIRPNGRKIRVNAVIPYTAAAHSALYIARYDGAGSISLDGSKNLAGVPFGADGETTFTMPRLFASRQTPTTPGRTEIPLQLDMTAYRTSGAEPLTVTNIVDAA